MFTIMLSLFKKNAPQKVTQEDIQGKAWQNPKCTAPCSLLADSIFWHHHEHQPEQQRQDPLRHIPDPKHQRCLFTDNPNCQHSVQQLITNRGLLYVFPPWNKGETTVSGQNSSNLMLLEDVRNIRDGDNGVWWGVIFIGGLFSQAGSAAPAQPLLFLFLSFTSWSCGQQPCLLSMQSQSWCAASHHWPRCSESLWRLVKWNLQTELK